MSAQGFLEEDSSEHDLSLRLGLVLGLAKGSGSSATHWDSALRETDGDSWKSTKKPHSSGIYSFERTFPSQEVLSPSA